jgi:hypothetical protein
MTRDVGFYWVKGDDGKWNVAEWHKNEWGEMLWSSVGSDFEQDDACFAEIGFKIHEPEE